MTAVDAAPRVHPAYALLALGVACIVAAFAIGGALYPGMPATVATHWDSAGHADEFAPKSAWSVFGPLFVALLVNAALLGAAFAARFSRRPTLPASTPQQAAAQVLAQQHALVSGLGWLQLVLSAGISAICVVTWTHAGAAALGLVIGAFAAAVIATVVVMVVRSYFRLARGGRVAAGADDPHWRWGVFYVNRHDRAAMVPKRYGLGWTVNLGSVGGVAILVLIVALLAAAVVVPLVASR